MCVSGFVLVYVQSGAAAFVTVINDTFNEWKKERKKNLFTLNERTIKQNEIDI